MLVAQRCGAVRRTAPQLRTQDVDSVQTGHDVPCDASSPWWKYLVDVPGRTVSVVRLWNRE